MSNRECKDCEIKAKVKVVVTGILFLLFFLFLLERRRKLCLNATTDCHVGKHPVKLVRVLIPTRLLQKQGNT